MAQLYAKDITPDDKQELDEALQREVITFCYIDLMLILVKENTFSCKMLILVKENMNSCMAFSWKLGSGRGWWDLLMVTAH